MTTENRKLLESVAILEAVGCINCNDTGMLIRFDDTEIWYEPCPYCEENEND